MLKENKGITLVALVITIIVLLILAGVSIAMISGDEGLLTKAGEAQTNSTKAKLVDAVQLGLAQVQLDYNGDWTLIADDDSVTPKVTNTSDFEKAIAQNYFGKTVADATGTTSTVTVSAVTNNEATVTASTDSTVTTDDVVVYITVNTDNQITNVSLSTNVE